MRNINYLSLINFKVKIHRQGPCWKFKLFEHCKHGVMLGAVLFLIIQFSMSFVYTQFECQTFLFDP